MARYILKRFSSFPSNFGDLLKDGYHFSNNLIDRIKPEFNIEPEKHRFSLFGNKKEEAKSVEVTISFEEVKEFEQRLPKEYNILQEISRQVTSQYSSLLFKNGADSNRLFSDVLPSFININSIPFITKYAKQKKVDTGISFGPILAMHEEDLVFYYDFDNSFWFCRVAMKEGWKEIQFRSITNFWKFLLDEFKFYRRITPDSFTNQKAIDIVLNYLDFNIKLIKKYGKL